MAIVIEQISMLTDNQFVTTSNGIDNVRPNVPFRMIITNLDKKPTRMSHAFPHPAYISETQIIFAEVLNDDIMSTYSLSPTAATNTGEPPCDELKEKREEAQVLTAANQPSNGSRPPIGAEQNTEILMHNSKTISVAEIPLDGMDE